MNQRNESVEMDNQLAEFSDRILNDEETARAEGLTGELADLEKTVLRLNAAASQEALNEAQSKRMLLRLKERMRREQEEKAPFWKRFFNPQFGFLVVAAALTLFLVVNAPAVVNPDLSGTATSKSGVYVAAGVLTLFMAAYWLMRKK
ncbi:MAG: hypothetical protein LC099_10370 [Anaerolineales bacterium]|nr:hypothetical protein [Anaerolineales bacterium]